MASQEVVLSHELLAQLLLSESINDALEVLTKKFPFLSQAEFYKKNDLSWSLVASSKNYNFSGIDSDEFLNFIEHQNIHRMTFEGYAASNIVSYDDIHYFYAAKTSEQKERQITAVVIAGAMDGDCQKVIETLELILPVIENLYARIEQDKFVHKLNKKFQKEKSSSDLHRSLLDNVGDVVFYHDEKGKLIDINQQAIISLGYSKSELLTKRIKDIDLKVNEGLSLTNILKNKVKPSQPVTLQSSYIRHDGSRFPVEVTFSFHESGNFLAVARDISKRTQIRKELEETRNFLQNVIDLSESLIYAYDFKQDKIIKGENKIENVLGYPTGSIKTLQDVFDICHPDDIEEIQRNLKLTYDPNHKAPIDFDDRIKDASGRWRWVKNYFRVFERDENGKPLLLVATATEITRYKELEEGLVKSQNKYKALVENSFDAIAVFNKDNRVTYASPSAYRMLRYGVGDARKLLFDDFIYSEDRDLIVKAWRKILENPARPITIPELRIKKKNGELIWAKATLNNLLNDKFVQGIVANISDLTAEKKALSQVAQKEHYYKSMVEKAFDGAVLYDVSGNVLFASDNSCKILGYDSAEEAPQNALEYVHPEDISIPKAAWKRVLVRPYESIDTEEYRVIKKDGAPIWIENTLTNLLDDPNVGGIVSNFKDISHRKNTEQSLFKVSNYDSVTGLPNRKFLLEQLNQQVKQFSQLKGQFGLVILDIDSLSAINTAHGHTVGDEVIHKVAETIKSTVSVKDFVAKTGDDEFAVIFSGQSTYEVSRHCQEILDKFTQLITIQKHKVKVSLTAGIAIYPKDALNSRELVSNAEIALKKAKQDVESFAFYKNYDSENTRYRLDLEKDLLEALAQEQLSMVYQPIIDSKSGEITYLESLLRWEHPQKGEIPPNLFVRIAEESNLIGRLSQWVLNSVVQQISLWNEMGLSPKVTINLSPMDLRRKNITNDITECLAKHRVAPGALAVEITESEELLDLEFVISQMNELNQLGVGIILDDFGTGFSSISHLINLPITAAKIDKSFIQRLDSIEANETQGFLNGIIKLIQSSNVLTIAEGIETLEQFQQVSDNDKFYCQGYLFSKPLPVNEVTALLKNKFIDLA